jgi:hypothetical protein
MEEIGRIIENLLLWEVDPPFQTTEISSMRGVCVCESGMTQLKIHS